MKELFISETIKFAFNTVLKRIPLSNQKIKVNAKDLKKSLNFHLNYKDCFYRNTI